MRNHCLNLVALTAVLAASQANAQECAPDYAALTWLSSTDSMDQEIANAWCAGSDLMVEHYSYYWYKLQLDGNGSFWNEQAALDGGQQCSSDSYIIRLMNGAYMLDQVMHHSANSVFEQTVYDWLGYVSDDGDGYTMDICDDDDPTAVATDVVATNPSSGRTLLHYPFFGWYSASQRASTLYHEAIHQHGSSHLDDDQCTAGGSCDDAYGNGNAQTGSIRFLEFAIDTYRRVHTIDEPGADGELMVANLGNDQCGYVPLLSPFERSGALSLARFKFFNHFNVTWSADYLPWVLQDVSYDPYYDYGGITYASDVYRGTRWDCSQVCNPADFQPGGREYCDPTFRAANTQVNQYNVAQCEAANNQLLPGVTPSQRQAIATSFQASKHACVPGVDQSYVDALCQTLSSQADTTEELANLWNLPDQPGAFNSGLALAQCMMKYCDQVFDPAWVEPAEAACYEWDDPRGCFVEQCGELVESNPYSRAQHQQAECRRSIIQSHVPSSGIPPTSGSHTVCGISYQDCVDEIVYQDWSAARQAGECNMVASPTGQSSLPGYQDGALDGMLQAGSYREFMNRTPGFYYDTCVGGFVLCTGTQGVITDAMLAAVVEKHIDNPWQRRVEDPKPPPYNKGDRLTVRGFQELAAFVVNERQDRLERKAGLKEILATAEDQLVLARHFGYDNYFALLGSKDREGVFGPAVVERYAQMEPQLELGVATSAAQREAFSTLAKGAALRARVESAGTKQLMADAVRVLSPSTMFEFSKKVGNASSVDEINAALNELSELAYAQ